MPIYCNDNILLYVGDNSLESYKDYLKNAGLKQMKEEANREDISKEEFYLYNIISACECILDDMENGANIEQADFNNLGYVDGIMLRMQHNVNKQLNPTNIKDD
jgi:hypothetical protein|tara:strand:+ start:3116 stop:3427 length:312 start_codon:yes stop_codon:yes gene_type:complete